jgi:hypothetical protein
MAQSIFNFHLGQAPRDSFLGGVMQRQIFNSHRRLQGNTASRFGALLAMTGLLLLSACGGGKSGVTDNNLAEPPFKDGVPPTLNSTTTDDSVVVYCGDDCPEPVGSLAGDWRLDPEGITGVGPNEGDVSWWSADEQTVIDRACWFDDVYRLGEDGPFQNIQGDESWIEQFAGGPELVVVARRSRLVMAALAAVSSTTRKQAP